MFSSELHRWGLRPLNPIRAFVISRACSIVHGNPSVNGSCVHCQHSVHATIKEVEASCGRTLKEFATSARVKFFNDLFVMD